MALPQLAGGLLSEDLAPVVAGKVPYLLHLCHSRWAFWRGRQSAGGSDKQLATHFPELRQGEFSRTPQRPDL